MTVNRGEGVSQNIMDDDKGGGLERVKKYDMISECSLISRPRKHHWSLDWWQNFTDI